MAKEKLEKCDCPIRLSYRLEHRYVTESGEEKLYVETAAANMPTSTRKTMPDGSFRYWLVFPDKTSGWKI